jgi:hypothetical protein
VSEKPAVFAAFVNTGAGKRQRLAVLTGSPDDIASSLAIYGGLGTAPREPRVLQEVDLLNRPRDLAAIELAPEDAFTDILLVEQNVVPRVILLAGPDYAPSSTTITLIGFDNRGIEIGDLNGDNIEDATAFAGGELRLITGTAAGGVTSSASVSVAAQALARPVGTRVAVAEPCDDCSAQPFVRLFDARGGERSRLSGLDGAFAPSAIASGRLDGDLMPDLLLGNRASDRKQFVLAVRGAGDSASPGLAALQASEPVTCLAIADLDGAGPPEIAACSPEKQMLLIFPGVP